MVLCYTILLILITLMLIVFFVKWEICTRRFLTRAESIHLPPIEVGDELMVFLPACIFSSVPDISVKLLCCII